MTTFTEEQIRSRHKERVSALVDLFGSTMAIPNDIIRRLQERNKEDWIQFVAERDGKAKSTDAPLMPVVTDEQVAAVEAVSTATPVEVSPFGDEINVSPNGDNPMPAAVLECVAAGTHLQSCDEDGYCNTCGHQEAPDNVETS